MDTPPTADNARGLPAWAGFPEGPVPAVVRATFRLQDISRLLVERRQADDEEMELIEMRCQPLLARMQLEELFAENQIGWR
jgi:hypothetical protein